MEKIVSWNIVIRHYEKSIEDGFDFSTQLELIKQIANSDYANHLHPSTSHFWLNLSIKEDYNERQNFPSIAVQQIDEKRFEIIYSPKQSQTHNISKRILCYSEVWSYLESLFIKLKFDSETFESD